MESIVNVLKFSDLFYGAVLPIVNNSKIQFFDPKVVKLQLQY